ncbi:MAG TPA: DNA alkylation repair protein [Chloroflexi bacterium]|nr:DNA alkylation repair protein [Chloroflexota bacterium]
MVDLKEETRRILAGYRPADASQVAGSLETLWSQVPATETGAALVKAEIREGYKALGVPVPALTEIGKEVGRVARKRVDDFLPLARLLWEQGGREGRLVACTFLGDMELAAPERVLPTILELAPTCLTWEECDQLAMRALEPIVRKRPEVYLSRMEEWVRHENKWVRRAGITVIGRLPMKHPGYTETCLDMVEPALGDPDRDVQRAVSFAVRLAARGDPRAVHTFIERQSHRTDAASLWVLCDAMRSMTKKLLPEFKGLLPVYRTWLTQVDARSQKSVVAAIRVLEGS